MLISFRPTWHFTMRKMMWTLALIFCNMLRNETLTHSLLYDRKFVKTPSSLSTEPTGLTSVKENWVTFQPFLLLIKNYIMLPGIVKLADILWFSVLIHKITGLLSLITRPLYQTFMVHTQTFFGQDVAILFFIKILHVFI